MKCLQNNVFVICSSVIIQLLWQETTGWPGGSSTALGSFHCPMAKPESENADQIHSVTFFPHEPCYYNSYRKLN